MNPVRICPSILNADRKNLRSEIAKIESSADWLHLDIMDGLFVPATTFSFDESVEIIRDSKIPVDAHLMIANPDDGADAYANAGAFSVTFHLEASKDPRSTLKAIRKTGAKASLAIKPSTPVESTFDYLDDLDMLLVMTVEPGAGGQSFMGDMLEKVRTLRDIFTQSGRGQLIQVDGGISLDTISEAARAGADTFVAGSAVYKATNPSEMVDSLRRLAAASFKA
jgi:ribulose-phosphate 3-epimerase